MTRLRIVVTLVVAILGARSALAATPPWSASFGTAAVGSYVPDGKPAVLVAAAGDGEEAGAALVKALRKSGRAPLVMEGDALGDVSGLGDEAIVKRAASQPVKVIVIVRVFAGAKDEPESAIVTFYEHDGRVRDAFTVRRGEPADPRGANKAGGLGVASGVSPAAAGAVDKVLRSTMPSKSSGSPDKATRPSPAEQDYQRRFLGFFKDDDGGDYRGSGAVPGWGGPYQGWAMVAIEPDSFYDQAGRADLARAYRVRKGIRAGLIGGGAGALSVGAILAMVGGLWGVVHPFCTEQDTYGSCLKSDNAPNSAVLGAGLGLVGVGVVAIVIGKLLPRLPTSIGEMYRLARERNRKLREDLGLPEAPDENVPKTSALHLSLTPVFASRSGGVSLKLEFSMRLAFAALALCVSVAPHVARADAGDPLAEIERRQQELFARVGPSVVFIAHGDSFGSGFFAGEGGLILTNAHVVGDAKEVKVVTTDGHTFTGAVEALAPDRIDLALVRVKGATAPALKLHASPELKVGAWVASVGHGRGGVWSFNVGMISNIYPDGEDRPVFQTQIPLNHGNSGGPVVDWLGRVIGVVTSGIDNSNSINFAIRSEVALKAFPRLGGECDCLTVLAPDGVAVFVDGKMAGVGPRVLVDAAPGAHEVFAVIGGAMRKRKANYPAERTIELK